MLWKCWVQYACKFGKLSSGHRTRKGQFSFQSQRRTMLKSVQTTIQLYSFHMLARLFSKSFKLGFMNQEIPDVQAGFRKHRETRNQIVNVCWIREEAAAAAAAKSLQSCPTLCEPIDGSPPGSAVPGILQAGTLEWVAISFSNAWKWKVKVKSLSRVQLSVTPWTAATRLLCPWDFPGKSTGVGCHCLLRLPSLDYLKPTPVPHPPISSKYFLWLVLVCNKVEIF